MALSKEQLAQIRADITAHNDEVKVKLRVVVETLAEALNEAIVVANELQIIDLDDTPRLRDTLISAGAHLKINLDQVVRPLLAPTAPPAPPAA